MARKKRKPKLTQNGTKMVTIWVPPEVHDLAKAVAKHLGKLQSRVWEDAMRQYAASPDQMA